MAERRPRRSIRLQGYDYASPGAYFVTICTHQRELLFEDPQIRETIDRTWDQLPSHFPNVRLDAFVIMPNHLHGVLFIASADAVGARHASPLQQDGPWLGGARPGSLGAIVGSFKAAVTRELRLRHLWSSDPFWQRNYYERIIRDEVELNRIHEYIAYNPDAWAFDHENPSRTEDSRHDLDWAWLEARLAE